MTADSSLTPLLLDALKVRRVWGGDRFSTDQSTIGEVWLVHQDNVILQGPCAGSTLGAAVHVLGSDLLGRRLLDAGEREFPLLIKLIDTTEWLSVQVHPDDARAAELEGLGHRGKTEAWYVLASKPGAEIIAGILPGVTSDQFEQAVRSGTILDVVQRFDVQPGDAIFLPAGAVHALGPGMFIYEIQQSSDITYRIFDWNRPEVEGRALHLDQSIRSANPSLNVRPVSIGDPNAGELAQVAISKYFRLELGKAGREPFRLAPAGEVFHAITVIDGQAMLKGTGWQQPLAALETAVIPASIASYSITSFEGARFLLAQPA